MWGDYVAMKAPEENPYTREKVVGKVGKVGKFKEIKQL